MPNLGNPSARKWTDTPIPNFIFTITETKEIILLGMEIEGYDRGTVPCVSMEAIAWLHRNKWS